MPAHLSHAILLVGGGGHARAVADVVQSQGDFELAGIVDSVTPPGTVRFGSVILGRETDIPKLVEELGNAHVFVAVGDNFQRAAISDRIRTAVPNVRFATLIHPSAVVAGDVLVGAGSVLMPGSVVVAGAIVGEGCIVNTCASLDHDSQMKAWSSLGPGAVIGGNACIGSRSSIGLGASVIHGVRVGEDTVVGAGSVVVTDLPDLVVAFGSPCHAVRGRPRNEPYL